MSARTEIPEGYEHEAFARQRTLAVHRLARGAYSMIPEPAEATLQAVRSV